MVQDKKNFSSVKRNMDETKDQDKKGQARSADSTRSTNIKGQSNLSKDKADISKRDVNSRK
jgi:hypothetical protein